MKKYFPGLLSFALAILLGNFTAKSEERARNSDKSTDPISVYWFMINEGEGHWGVFYDDQVQLLSSTPTAYPPLGTGCYPAGSELCVAGFLPYKVYNGHLQDYYGTEAQYPDSDLYLYRP